MRSIIFLLAIAAIVFTACKQNEPKTDIPLKYSDEVYTLVKAGKGETPEEGDFSVFSLMIKGDDGRILLDRSQEENYGKYQVPADTSSRLKSGSPIDELLSVLVEGDSAVLVYVLDSLEKMNPSVMGLESIIYELSIKEVLNQEEMDAKNEVEKEKQDAKIAVAKEKESLVAARLEEVLKAYKDGSLGDALKRTESGMEYVIEKQGDGPMPAVGENCAVHYYGILESNGEMFDNSYQRGDFFSFPVGQGRVIQGWDEALLMMNKGTEGIFFIPFEMAYGAAGRPPRIPEKAMLVFFIEYP